MKKEIIHYPMMNQTELESWPAFGEADLAQHWREMLHRRIIQHNIRVASLYYRQIHGTRLAQLLGLEPQRLEQEIAAMVSDRSVFAKIHRPHDIVRFAPVQSPEMILSEWATNVEKLLQLVETTTHLIKL